jgi:KilA-N domain
MNNTKPTIILRHYDGSVVEQRRKDGYINATSMSQSYFAFSGKRRDVSTWLKLARTKETLKHLSGVVGITVTELYQVFQGAHHEKQGTYLHPKLATRFGIWLSDEYGYQVECWVEDWLLKGREIPKQEIIEYLFPAECGAYVLRFKPEFRDRFEFVMKASWNSPAAMGFISRTLYQPLMDADARRRMNEINPQKQDGRRNRKHIQHNAPEFDEKVQERIKIIQVLLNVSRGKQSFWTNYNAEFGAEVQGGFDLADLL